MCAPLIRIVCFWYNDRCYHHRWRRRREQHRIFTLGAVQEFGVDEEALFASQALHEHVDENTASSFAASGFRNVRSTPPSSNTPMPQMERR